MNELYSPLDLSIILTTSERDPPETLGHILLRCEPLNLFHSGDLLANPLTNEEREDLRWYLEEYWRWPYEGFAARGKQVEALLIEVGKRLYRGVFGSIEAQTLLQQWQKQSNVHHQISIISQIPSILNLPWELLFDLDCFLTLRSDHPISIVRCLPQNEQISISTPFKPPLRILLITARPEDAGFIDPRNIARELVDELDEQVKNKAIDLEFLRPPTFLSLCTRLKDKKRPVHVLHFDGHGAFDEEAHGQGVLIFETEAGKASPVLAAHLAKVLQDSEIRLAVLNACQSAMSATNDPFSSVVAQLIRSGVDAVVAMSSPILATSASRYVEALYRSLAAGIPVPLAQERARQALHHDRRRHLLRRHRHEEGLSVELEDWWIPHFYQQRPLILLPQAVNSREKKGQLQDSFPSLRLSENMPAEPHYGFGGRSRELLQIERSLLRRKLVVIHGFGGNGKTALVREAADWLTRTKMYEGACFVSFEHGGDVTAVLRVLGNYLRVYDSGFNSQDPTSALGQLGPILKKKRTLLIVDNVESILPKGKVPLESAMLSQLWGVLLGLAQMSAGVLLTSRDTNFGDRRLAPGNDVTHLRLDGLHAEDAYALACRLLGTLAIDRRRAPYAEIHDLLRQLDYQPLAIQLVLPMLRDFPLSKIKAELAALLPILADSTVEGHHASLLASLECSLQRLSEEQRALLCRLAFFEGGAFEDTLLLITKISATKWAELRLALEQAALVTVEIYPVPFVRFHPVLAPFLRSQIKSDDMEEYLVRYKLNYLRMPGTLALTHDHNPKMVAVRIQLEFPNIWRAMGLWLEAKQQPPYEVDLVTADMIENFTRLANLYGLEQERNELLRRVAEIIPPRNDSISGELTLEEYLYRRSLGETELQKGNLSAAIAIFTDLLSRIEAMPSGDNVSGLFPGYGSDMHFQVLLLLGRCLRNAGKSSLAESRLRQALAIIDTLIKEPLKEELREDVDRYREALLRNRHVTLTTLGDALRNQGQYQQAKALYEESRKFAEQQGDLRQQAVALSQIGRLALEFNDYVEARARFTATLKMFQDLGEPVEVARTWHALGVVAQGEEQWSEAEQCYRESLMLGERIGDSVGTAMTYFQLARLTIIRGRRGEAEGWLMRALELNGQVDPHGPLQAQYSDELAAFLVEEVQEGRAPQMRLAEARNFAERALAIKEILDASEYIWNSLATLAEIAHLEGRTEDERVYRRRERETFASFKRNRDYIDLTYSEFIAAIVDAARGDTDARKWVEDNFSQPGTDSWRIISAVHRIWEGERNWYSLVEDLEGPSALLLLRVLETIMQPAEMSKGESEEDNGSFSDDIYN